jgi:hypothetical protein
MMFIQTLTCKERRDDIINDHKNKVNIFSVYYHSVCYFTYFVVSHIQFQGRKWNRLVNKLSTIEFLSLSWLLSPRNFKVFFLQTHIKFHELKKLKKTKLRGRSPQANYNDRATATCRAKLVSNFAGRGCCVVSETNSHGR